MRLLKDLRDWLALRRHLQRPWSFVRTRTRDLPGPWCDVFLRDGGTLRLRTDTDDRQVFNDVFARDEYGVTGLADLDTVIDVGAHVGAFSVRVATIARRVLSYEPFPASHDLLVENTRRFPHVTVFRQAVAGRRAAAPLFIGNDPCNNSLVRGLAGDSTITVDAVTLADVFEQHRVDRCDLLKLDVEGAEYDILQGATDDVLRRVRRIVLEYHPVEGASAERLAGHLSHSGFRVRLRPRRRRQGKGVLFGVRG